MSRNDEDLLKREHFAVILSDSKSIYHEGDERSRTNPGHGYPAYTETVKSIEYMPFETADEVASWVKHRRPSDARSYRIIKASPMKVSTSVSISLEGAGT